QQGSTSKKTRQGLPQYWKFHQHDLLFVRQTEIQLPTVFHIEPEISGCMNKNPVLFLWLPVALAD
ncbi:hypothetical protein, partial [Ferrovum myxofaciens]|uniref:hypothetical protein n=1 Tax=Ferrovum myxofaciens TaxID=416213 RepID=UPI001F22CD17